MTRSYMEGGASAPLIRIGDLRSRRSKGGQQFTDHEAHGSITAASPLRPCREKDFRWKTKAGKCPNT